MLVQVVFLGCFLTFQLLPFKLGSYQLDLCLFRFFFALIFLFLFVGVEYEVSYQVPAELSLAHRLSSTQKRSAALDQQLSAVPYRR